MTTHDLKCWPEFFQPLWDGDKTAEIRLNDRDYQVGDILHQREWVHRYVQGVRDGGSYTGREVDHLVTHIVKGPAFGIQEGFVMMSIKPLTAITVPLSIRKFVNCEEQDRCVVTVSAPWGDTDYLISGDTLLEAREKMETAFRQAHAQAKWCETDEEGES